MKAVVTFAGRIASGKLTLSQAVAQTLGCPRVGFGDYLRAEAGRRGLGEGRTVLQDLGEQTIQQLGWIEFCRVVLAQAGWQPGQSIVVDGIRHEDAIKTLRQIVAPLPCYLIYIQVDDDQGAARLLKRGEQPPDKEHSTEVQVENGLSEIADIILDGTKTLVQLNQEVVAWLQRTLAEADAAH